MTTEDLFLDPQQRQARKSQKTSNRKARTGIDNKIRKESKTAAPEPQKESEKQKPSIAEGSESPPPEEPLLFAETEGKREKNTNQGERTREKGGNRLVILPDWTPITLRTEVTEPC